MRISDWSSDVCSSDLQSGGLGPADRDCGRAVRQMVAGRGLSSGIFQPRGRQQSLLRRGGRTKARQVPEKLRRPAEADGVAIRSVPATAEPAIKPAADHAADAWRPEENTSDLQSLMRIPHAV